MAIRRTILQTIPIPELPGYEQRLVLLEYPPGFPAPIHTHPVAAAGYVLQGNVVSQWDGGEEERYAAGDSFVDLGTTRHIRSENESKDQELKMLCFYVIKVGQPNVQIE